MWDRIRNYLKMFENALQGLETIQGVTKTGGPGAATALQTIDAIVTSILGGFTGALTPDEVEKQLDDLKAKIAANDAAADAAVDSKFGTGK